MEVTVNTITKHHHGQNYENTRSSHPQQFSCYRFWQHQGLQECSVWHFFCAKEIMKFNILIWQQDLFFPFELKISCGSLQKSYYSGSTVHDVLLERTDREDFLLTHLRAGPVQSATHTVTQLFFFIDWIKYTARKKMHACQLQTDGNQTNLQKITVYPLAIPTHPWCSRAGGLGPVPEYHSQMGKWIKEVANTVFTVWS